MPNKDVQKIVRQKWFLDICKGIVNKYVFGASDVHTLVEETQHLQDATTTADCVQSTTMSSKVHTSLKKSKVWYT